MTAIGDAAQALAMVEGFRVFPCRADKKPACHNGFHDATADFDEIAALFDKPSVAAIGLATGRVNGIIVIDVDVKKGARGEEWLEANRSRLPPTRRHSTPSGGHHFIFKMPADAIIGSSVSKLAPNVDVRANGGYALWPPSPGYSIADSSEIAAAPDWLLGELPSLEGRKASRLASAPLVELDNPTAMDLARNYARGASSAIEGSGGDAHTFSITCGMRDLGVSDTVALEILLTEWNDRCVPPWDPDELGIKVKNAYAYAQNAPGSKHPHADFEGVQLAPATPGRLQPPAMPSETHVKAFRFLTADALLKRAFPPRETVLSPWLPSKGLVMIYGPRGIGKTHLTLGCAYAIASGGEFLCWPASTPRRVLVIDGEMPAVTLQERLARIVDVAMQAPPDPAHLRFLAMDLQDGGFDLANEADQRAIESELTGADVIFIDNISTLARNGRENEAESWLPVQEWALKQRRAGRSVVFMHHAGKGGLQRGTSRREDVLDTVIALRRPRDYQADQGARFEVHFEKNRGFHGDDAKPFEAALGAGGWTMRNLADADMARVMALKADGLSVREIAEETGIAKSRVFRLQLKAEKTARAGQIDA